MTHKITLTFLTALLFQFNCSWAFDLEQISFDIRQRYFQTSRHIHSGHRNFLLDIQNKGDSEVEEYFNQNFIVNHYNPYILYSAHDPRLSIITLKQHLFQLAQVLGLNPEGHVNWQNNYRLLKEFYSAQLNVPPPSDIDPSKVLSSYHNWNTEVTRLQANSRLVCSKYSSGCRTALEKLVDRVRPISYVTDPNGNSTMYMNARLVREVVTDPSYRRPALKMAIALLDKIHDTLLGQPVEGNIFLDLLNLFSQDVPPHQAYQLAWDFLGVYSLRGASTLHVYHGFNFADKVTYSTLSVLANIISAFDNILPEGSESYAYPGLTLGKARYGKHYRFWQQAYLANHLYNVEGKSKNASLDAAHILMTFYESMANTIDRNGFISLARPMFSAHNNQLRFNILFTDLGAYFAIEGEEKMKELNWDEVILYNFQKSKNIKKDRFKSRAHFYLKWRKYLGSEKHLKTFYNLMR